jgi:hypothetical protein
MATEYRGSARGSPSPSIDAAWRGLEAAGAARPAEADHLAAETDKRRREEAVEAQLAYLKKKMGKDKK